MIRVYLAATGAAGRAVEIPIPGALGQAMRSGGLLPGAGAKLGTQTFAEWLSLL